MATTIRTINIFFFDITYSIEYHRQKYFWSHELQKNTKIRISLLTDALAFSNYWKITYRNLSKINDTVSITCEPLKSQT